MEQTQNLDSALIGKSESAAGLDDSGTERKASLGKFKSVDELYKAYSSLEAEFTRRSQRLKELEKAVETAKNKFVETEAKAITNAPEAGAPAPYTKRADTEEILPRFVGRGGSAALLPPREPKSIAEAGAMAVKLLSG